MRTAKLDGEGEEGGLHTGGRGTPIPPGVPLEDFSLRGRIIFQGEKVFFKVGGIRYRDVFINGDGRVRVEQ